jgi:hypothetical protein
MEPTIARRYIDALVPGGVPDREQRVKLVVDLLQLTDEAPEIDVDASNDILTRAARCVFADGLAIADIDLPIKLEIDKLIREYDDERDKATRLPRPQGEGMPRSDDWYCGLMEGLQLLRMNLLGHPLPTRRNA